MLNCNESPTMKVVGYWFNEKKSQKFGGNELAEACRKRNMNFIQINLEKGFQRQDKYDVILHKLTALYAPALLGDTKAQLLIKNVEEFVSENPHIFIIDPLKSVKKLLLRVDTYSMLSTITNDYDEIYTPNFMKLTEEMVRKNLDAALEENQISFPVVCKPLLAGGGKDAHEMAVVFKKEELQHCSLPCVAQSFVKHDAVLYKIFVLGDKWFVAIRPSLKNFEAGDFDSIIFNSHHISKPDSHSPLTFFEEEGKKRRKADIDILERIVLLVRNSLDSDLLGIDVVLNKSSGRYGIIDVNPFPNYDSVPDLMENLADAIAGKMSSKNVTESKLTFQPTLNFDQKYFLQDVSMSFSNFFKKGESNTVTTMRKPKTEL